MTVLRMFTVVYCSTLLLILSANHRDQLKYVRVTCEVVRPARVLGLWSVPRLSTAYFNLAGAVLFFSLVLAALGIAVRVWLVLTIVAYFVYFGQLRTLSYVGRKANLIPQLLAILFFAYSDRSISIHDDYPWPLVIMKVLVVQVYVSGAYCKLSKAGLRWATGRQMQGILMHQYLLFDIPGAIKLARHPRLCAVAASLVLFHQVSFPIIFFVRSAEVYYVAFAVLFHVINIGVMRIDYLRYHGPSYIVFLAVPLSRLMNRH
jgi:hypothetical protein